MLLRFAQRHSSAIPMLGHRGLIARHVAVRRSPLSYRCCPCSRIITFMVYALMLAIPGDPARALIGPGESLDEEQLELIRKEYNLDKPAIVQYGIWLGRALRGDLGRSTQNQRPVAEELGYARPGDTAVRHRRLDPGHGDRRARRHGLRRLPGQAGGFHHHDRVDRRRRDSQLLARHHGHPAVRGDPRLAADPRLRRHHRGPRRGFAAHDPAGVRARHHQLGPDHAPIPVGDARGARAGLHAYRAGQRACASGR